MSADFLLSKYCDPAPAGGYIATRHTSTPPTSSVLENAVVADRALSFIPAILFQLDADTREMFASVLQAMRDGGYADGFGDGLAQAKKASL